MSVKGILMTLKFFTVVFILINFLYEVKQQKIKII